MRLHALMIIALLPLSACRVGGERSVSDENDRLRTLVHEQEARIAELEGERDELTSKLSRPPRTGDHLLSNDVLAAIPTITRIEISGLSGLSPVDPRKPATSLAVSFRTFDGRGRFVHAVGVASIETFVLPEGTETPHTLRSARLNPTQLRDAFRSGFTGTHYSVEMPLDPPLPREVNARVLVQVRFEDVLTGRTHRAEKIIHTQPTLTRSGDTR